MKQINLDTKAFINLKIIKCFIILDKNYKNNGLRLKKGINECSELNFYKASTDFDMYQLFYRKGNKLGICHVDIKEDWCIGKVKKLILKKIYELTNLPYWGSKNFRERVIVHSSISNDDSLTYINKKYIDQELCNLAIEQCCSLKYVPVCFRTPELCYDAITDGDNLEFVPEELKTAELCMRAIRKGGSIKFVPEELKTAELLEQSENGGTGPRYSIGTPLTRSMEDCLGFNVSLIDEKESTDVLPVIVYAQSIPFILISDTPKFPRFTC
jgi:hypothetical protein